MRARPTPPSPECWQNTSIPRRAASQSFGDTRRASNRSRSTCDGANLARPVPRSSPLPREPRLRATVDRFHPGRAGRAAHDRRGHAPRLRPHAEHLCGLDDRRRRARADGCRGALRRNACRRIRPSPGRTAGGIHHLRLHRAAGYPRMDPVRDSVVALRAQHRQLRGELRGSRDPLGDRPSTLTAAASPGGCRPAGHHRGHHGHGGPGACRGARCNGRLRVDLLRRCRADDLAVPGALDAPPHRPRRRDRQTRPRVAA